MNRSNPILAAVRAGGVILGGAPIALDSEVGITFIRDCCRHTEGLLSDSEIKKKWVLSDEDWMGLADNTPLLEAVRAERQRRIQNGDAARAAAQLHYAKAPSVLGDILADKQISPRHRIEAARELRQADLPATASDAAEKFVITINLGEDKLVFEKDIAPQRPSDDGEAM